jgi:serine/threonine-protein kinase
MSPAVLSGGRYRLEDRIAVGGVGEVWRGVDTVLGRSVAVKLLRAQYAGEPEVLARFRGEARHAGALSHPAIARVHDYHDADGQDPPYLVMELVDGPSLAALLVGGPLEPGRAMDVIAQVAAGLDAAHRAGVTHCDIKPANLLLDRLGHVKITDFGIARCAGSASVAGPGQVAGTPAYLAPELVGGAPATPASDLYALGIVGYECLTGHPPYAGTPRAVASAHRDLPLPPLPGTIPVPAAGLIGELTAKDPAGRPAGAAEVATRAGRLRDAMHEGAAVLWHTTGHGAERPTLPAIPLPGPPAGRAPRPPGGLGRWLWIAAALSALVVLLAIGVPGMLTAAAPPGKTAAPRQESALALVDVNASSLTGLPVSVVGRELRQLGLVVRVRWQPTTLEPAGMVISVQPGGRVPPGTVIVVTGALQPQPTVTGPEHDHGGDRGDGGGGSDGGGSGGGGTLRRSDTVTSPGRVPPPRRVGRAGGGGPPGDDGGAAEMDGDRASGPRWNPRSPACGPRPESRTLRLSRLASWDGAGRDGDGEHSGRAVMRTTSSPLPARRCNQRRCRGVCMRCHRSRLWPRP